MPNYKYHEDEALEWVKTYIDSTYSKHYAKGSIQTTEFVFDAGHGEGFCIGNIIKYAQRYGKKEGKNIVDLMKVIHYAIILLGVSEKEREAALDGKRYAGSQEKGTRKLDGGKYSKSNQPAPAHFTGGEAYNKERSL